MDSLWAPCDVAGVSALPSGTVTFLFTDIEQSTRSWEDHTSAMERALARHDEIVRLAVESLVGCVCFQSGFERAMVS